MNKRSLRAYLKKSGLTQSELARRVGVSRQAVSLWLTKPGVEQVEVRGSHLLRAAAALGVAPGQLAESLPCLGDWERKQWLALLLWDGLYPDLDELAIAVNEREGRAVARLVEVVGLYASEKILGSWVWSEFPGFARYIHPARRRQLEGLRQWHDNQRVA